MAKKKSVSTYKESIEFNGNHTVDREQHVIRGVKVLGSISANGRVYTAEAMTKALPLYEGATVFLDHVSDPRQNRSVRDDFGTIVNVRLKEDAIFGDLAYNPHHPNANQLLHWAENNNRKVGLSHSVEGRHTAKNGKQFVEEIYKVHSVDLVRNPATTSGLFESKENMEIKDVEGLKAAVAAVLENAELDLSGMAKALCDLAHPLLPAEPAEEKKDEEPKPEEDEAKKESIEALKEQVAELTKQIKQFERKDKINGLLKEAKIEVTDKFFNVLMEQESDSAITTLIEDNKNSATAQKPVSKHQHQIQESAEGVKDAKDFASRLKKKD